MRFSMLFKSPSEGLVTTESLVDEPEKPNLRLGLTVLHPKDGNDEKILVDIVTIHGLAGHPKKTWTNSTTDHYWPSKSLPQDIPLSRIMTFGYNSHTSALNNNSAMVSDIAKSLLSNLINKRRTEEQKCRPIIFVAHSLGGIILKEFLHIASNTGFDAMADCVCGILFLGTPHKGSELATFLQVLKNVTNSMFNRPPDAILKDLTTNSRHLLELDQLLRFKLGKIAIYSFYETKPIGSIHKLVVESSSALLNLPSEIEQIALDADHRQMCKPVDRNDFIYETIVQRIIHIMNRQIDREQFVDDLTKMTREFAFRQMEHISLLPQSQNEKKLTKSPTLLMANFSSKGTPELIAPFHGLRDVLDHLPPSDIKRYVGSIQNLFQRIESLHTMLSFAEQQAERRKEEAIKMDLEAQRKADKERIQELLAENERLKQELATVQFPRKTRRKEKRTKSVTWGENESNNFEFVTPAPKDDRQFGEGKWKARSRLDKPSQWSIIASAVAASSSEPGDEPEIVDTESPNEMDPSEQQTRDLGSEVTEHVYRVDDDSAVPLAPGPEPASPKHEHISCGYAEDIEFASMLAGGLRDTGFDPSIVIDDPSYRRRASPPGSNELNDSDSNQPTGTQFLLGEIETPEDGPETAEPAEESSKASTSLKPEVSQIPFRLGTKTSGNQSGMLDDVAAAPLAPKPRQTRLRGEGKPAAQGQHTEVQEALAAALKQAGIDRRTYRGRFRLPGSEELNKEALYQSPSVETVPDTVMHEGHTDMNLHEGHVIGLPVPHSTSQDRYAHQSTTYDSRINDSLAEDTHDMPFNSMCSVAKGSSHARPVIFGQSQSSESPSAEKAAPPSNKAKQAERTGGLSESETEKLVKTRVISEDMLNSLRIALTHGQQLLKSIDVDTSD